MKTSIADNQGFTLIELLVVVAILGIVTAIAVPRFVDLTERSRMAADQATVRTLNSVTTLSRMSVSTEDPFDDPTKTGEQLIGFLVDGEFLTNFVEPQTPDAQFAWLQADARWYLLVGHAFHTVSLSDGFSFGLSGGQSSHLLGSYTGSSQNVVLPTSIDGVTVTQLGQDVFNGKDLVSVSFQNGSQIERIHARAFRNNDLSQIVFPNTLERIDLMAFRNNNLTEIVLPPNVHTIEQHAFNENPLTKVTIGSAVNTIGVHAFGGQTGQFKEAYAAGGAGTYALIDGNWVKQ